MNCFQYGWKWTFINDMIDDDEQSSFMNDKLNTWHHMKHVISSFTFNLKKLNMCYTIIVGVIKCCP